MPKVYKVNKARKDYPQWGIKKGDTYYWWVFRYGGEHKSKTYPKPSQLTQSDFLSRVYDIEDRLGSLSSDMSVEALEDEINTIVDELNELSDEQLDKQSNMPDSLQNAPTGQLLEDRANYLQDMISELEGIDFSLEDEPDYTPLTEEQLKDKPVCERCEKEQAKHKTNDEKIICDICLEDWTEEKEQERQDRIEEILNEIQSVSYSGE